MIGKLSLNLITIFAFQYKYQSIKEYKVLF